MFTESLIIFKKNNFFGHFVAIFGSKCTVSLNKWAFFVWDPRVFGAEMGVLGAV